MMCVCCDIDSSKLDQRMYILDATQTVRDNGVLTRQGLDEDLHDK